jgi:hypothetical protein
LPYFPLTAAQGLLLVVLNFLEHHKHLNYNDWNKQYK